MTNPTSGTLMVPIALEALVMNPYVRNSWTSTVWRRFTPDWQSFATLGTPPLGEPSQAALGTADDGVYLHWALPDALTHATVPKNAAATDASINFPFAPNRWIVVRVGVANGNTRPVVAWIIQSDYLTSYPTPAISGATRATSPYVHPFLSVAGTLQPAAIGTHIPIATYTGDLTSEGTRLFLTAAGPGDVTFAAYQPGANDVFAFFDSSMQSAPIGAYDYLVAGYYSDLSGDPLTSTVDWNTLLNSLKWTVAPGPNAPGQTAPTSAASIMCHGAVTGLNWVGVVQPSGPQSSGPADPTKLAVTIGSTTSDALCTDIQQYADAHGGSGTPSTGTLYQQHLQALMAGMLPSVGTPEGALRVQETVERLRFGSSYGGTSWTVVPASTAGMPAPSGPVTLTTAQQAALLLLNQQQTRLDTLSRQLAAAQWLLYTTWWKNMWASRFGNDYSPPESIPSCYGQGGGPPQCELGNWGVQGTQPPDPTTVEGWLATQLMATPGTPYSQVAQLQPLVQQLQAALPNPEDAVSITTYAQNTMQLGTTLTLKSVPSPRFYQPTDPVVLVHGMPASAKYGTNNSYDTNGNLLCRFDSQIVGGINYSGQQNITASQLGASIQVPTNSYLNANVLGLVQALVQELYFLDPANAPAIAQQVTGVSAATLATQMQAQQNMLGTPPALIALAPWKQPFSPLYLEWKVQYVFTPPWQKSSWTFDGHDYVFNGQVLAQYSQSYFGRALMTPHAADLYRQRVQSYVSDAQRAQAADPKSAVDPQLQAVLAELTDPLQLDSPNILSQSLSGLNAMLLLTDPTPNYPPDATVASMIGHGFNAAPFTSYVSAMDMRPTTPPVPPPTFFFPVRSGFFRFTRLDISDCFGQVVDLLAANGNITGLRADPDYFMPQLSRELAIDAGTTILNAGQQGNWMRLAPRVTQTTRLDLQLQPVVAGTDPNANPIHGWFVANHLDQSISIYDGAGIPLGEVLSVLDARTGGATTAVWSPAPPTPGAAAPPQHASDIADVTLRGAVTGLLAASTDGLAFQTFLDVIDETLWSIDPIGGRADKNLSVLMGRPLAVVQLKVLLEFEGDPAMDQSFTNIANIVQGQPPNTADLLTQQFKVRLGDMARGDDAVIGYFNAGLTAFNSVVNPTSVDSQSQASAYVQPIGVNGNFLTITAGPAGAITVPVLVDPRGNIHAITGIQPVAETTVPAQFVTSAEAAMTITFRTGPLLTDPRAIRIPRPAENNGAWNWVSYQAPTSGSTGTYVQQPPIPSSGAARLGDTAALNEGWLQFAPADVGS